MVQSQQSPNYYSVNMLPNLLENILRELQHYGDYVYVKPLSHELLGNTKLY